MDAFFSGLNQLFQGLVGPFMQPVPPSGAIPVWDHENRIQWIEPPAAPPAWDPMDEMIARKDAAPQPVPGGVQERFRRAVGPRMPKPEEMSAKTETSDAASKDFEDIAAGRVTLWDKDGIVRKSPMHPRAWTRTDPRWKALDPFQKAAAMALLEADNADPEDARNALAAMLNRAAKYKEDLAAHVSSRYYQPTFEPAQQRRLGRILKLPSFEELTNWARRYWAGEENDPTNGATHFLAHPDVMLSLEARNPSKYRSWRKWTGFDPVTKTYRNQTMSDRSHAFLAPEGRFSLGRR